MSLEKNLKKDYVITCYQILPKAIIPRQLEFKGNGYENRKELRKLYKIGSSEMRKLLKKFWLGKSPRVKDIKLWERSGEDYISIYPQQKHE